MRYPPIIWVPLQVSRYSSMRSTPKPKNLKATSSRPSGLSLAERMKPSFLYWVEPNRSSIGIKIISFAVNAGNLQATQKLTDPGSAMIAETCSIPVFRLRLLCSSHAVKKSCLPRMPMPEVTSTPLLPVSLSRENPLRKPCIGRSEKRSVLE